MLKLDFIIVTALPIEADSFSGLIEKVESHAYQYMPFRIGQIADKKIGILTSEIGETNAAIATTLAIRDFNPDTLIFSGIAGTLNHELAIGDVVIGETVFSAELIARYKSGKYLECKFGTLPSPKHHAKPVTLSFNQSFSVKSGVVATSDEFPISDNIDSYFENQPVDAVDMESASFAQTCKKFDKNWFVVRGISNYIDANKDAVINKSAVIASAKNAAMVTTTLVKNL